MQSWRENVLCSRNGHGQPEIAEEGIRELNLKTWDPSAFETYDAFISNSVPEAYSCLGGPVGAIDKRIKENER
jgi:hypothetical protein